MGKVGKEEEEFFVGLVPLSLAWCLFSYNIMYAYFHYILSPCSMLYVMLFPFLLFTLMSFCPNPNPISCHVSFLLFCCFSSSSSSSTVYLLNPTFPYYYWLTLCLPVAILIAIIFFIFISIQKTFFYLFSSLFSHSQFTLDTYVKRKALASKQAEESSISFLSKR